jgi:hypothetical protein
MRILRGSVWGFGVGGKGGVNILALPLMKPQVLSGARRYVEGRVVSRRNRP